VLIGGHVSPAGGPAKAVERGEEAGCTAIQIFNQNPRAWAPRVYGDDEVEAYRAALDGSPVEAVLIHAIYLCNLASEDPDMREKSLAAVTGSLRSGDALGAVAVVLHPGSALKGDVGAALERAAGGIAEALAESSTCPLHLEDTAGAGGTLGRTFEELARLLELAGGDGRLAVCLDSAHLYGSGYDVATAEGLAAAVDEFDRIVGLDRLGSLHLNDSQAALGSNVDRHAVLGKGELGRTGCAAFLSEPRFEGLPCVGETPADRKQGFTRKDVDLMWRLRREGMTERGLEPAPRPRRRRRRQPSR